MIRVTITLVVNDFWVHSAWNEKIDNWGSTPGWAWRLHRLDGPAVSHTRHRPVERHVVGKSVLPEDYEYWKEMYKRCEESGDFHIFEKRSTYRW